MSSYTDRTQLRCCFCHELLTQFGYDLWELKCEHHTPEPEMDYQDNGDLRYVEMYLEREIDAYRISWWYFEPDVFRLHKHDIKYTHYDNGKLVLSMKSYPLFSPEQAEQQLTHLLKLVPFS